MSSRRLRTNSTPEAITRKGVVTRAEESLVTISRQLSATQEALSRTRAYETVDITMRNGRPRTVSRESQRALACGDHATFTAAVSAAEILNEMTASLASTLRLALPEVDPVKLPPQLRRGNSTATVPVKVTVSPQTLVEAPPRPSSTGCCFPRHVPEQVVDAIVPVVSVVPDGRSGLVA
jgi:hypothetical protein